MGLKKKEFEDAIKNLFDIPRDKSGEVDVRFSFNRGHLVVAKRLKGEEVADLARLDE